MNTISRHPVQRAAMQVRCYDMCHRLTWNAPAAKDALSLRCSSRLTCGCRWPSWYNRSWCCRGSGMRALNVCRT